MVLEASAPGADRGPRWSGCGIGQKRGFSTKLGEVPDLVPGTEGTYSGIWSEMSFHSGFTAMIRSFFHRRS